MTSGREAVDLHVVGVGNVSSTIASNRDVVAKSAIGRQGIFFLERPRLQVEGFQQGRWLFDIVDRRKAHPECFGLFIRKNSQDSQCGLVIRLNPGLGSRRTRLYHVDGSSTNAANDDSTISSRSEALRINLFTGDAEFGGRVCRARAT